MTSCLFSIDTALWKKAVDSTRKELPQGEILLYCVDPIEMAGENFFDNSCFPYKCI